MSNVNGENFIGQVKRLKFLKLHSKNYINIFEDI